MVYGLFSGGVGVGGQFAHEILGAYFQEGLFLEGLILSEFYGIFPECLRYEVLTEADRAQHHRGPIVCDFSLPQAWYRFQGGAGKQMADKCVPEDHCGSYSPGWLSGGHPTVAQGVVQRKVCFHSGPNCCFSSSNIRVRNCSTFIVYELATPPSGSLCPRYCGDRDKSKPCDLL